MMRVPGNDAFSRTSSASPTHMMDGSSSTHYIPLKRTILPQVALVFLLYAVQGIPAGYTENYLPLVMYSSGNANLRDVGMVGALSAPWLLKFLWAPFVDQKSTKRVWIVATHCVMLVGCLLCASETSTAVGVLTDSMIVYLLLFITATGVEDCAVDGYAMQILREIDESGEAHEECLPISQKRLLAFLNAAQVVGFKIGHFYSGAPVWYVQGEFGYKPTWLFLAVPIMIASVLSFLFIPNAREKKEKEVDSVGCAETFSSAFKELRNAEMMKLMFAAMLYKAGEKIIMPMYKPFLVDSGVPADVIGHWVGTYGTVSSAAGSVLGAVLIDRMEVSLAARYAILTRALIFLISVSFSLGWGSIVLQGFGSGLVTPVMFGYFMKSVSGAANPVTAYTLLQTCDDLSRFIGYTVSGYIVEVAGYYPAFIGSCVLLAVPVFLLGGKKEESIRR